MAYAAKIERHHTLPTETAEHKRNLAGISEIVLATNSEESRDITFPMLAHLSKASKNRWFTWITDQPISKAVLAKYGFQLDHIRIIQSCGDSESLWLMWDALNNGTSDTVITDLSSLTEKDRQKLEIAAFNGNTRGLVLSHRY